MTSTDTLSQSEGREIFDMLSTAAPFELLLTMCKHGRPVTGSGFSGLDLTAIEVNALSGDPILLVFPSNMLAHRFANFFDVGPRPQVEAEGILGISRSDLDDPEVRAGLLQDVPQEIREGLINPEALRWSLTLRDRETGGELFARTLEVYDCVEGGVWAVHGEADEENEDAVALVPADSTMVWRGLSTLLPTEAELVKVAAGAP